ncbi:MAG: SNF2-related protein, partial [Candidatus Krumholzibacteria bacterium]|nr:SNF2-related protein [Candidatus Krumholzibacteria bacterium]
MEVVNESPLPVPAGLEYLPYQAEGIEFALGRRNTLIADEMGLGKTIQALGVINALDIRRVLIVCPASLRINWAREARKWLCRRREICIVNEKNTVLAGAEIVICNYDRVWDYWDRLAAVHWDLLIGDEAHYLKNPKSQRAKASLGGMIKTALGNKRKRGIAASAARLRLLTGTPILNKPIELYPLLKALDRERWGQAWLWYATRYCAATRQRVGRDKEVWDTSGASNLDELQRILRGTVMIRRRKMDVLKDLPPK